MDRLSTDASEPRSVSAASFSTVIDNIGLLVTNDPALGDGLLGLRRNAAVVFQEDRIVHVGDAGADADLRIDADGRCVLPGFVDSHTHLVFAGRRGAELAARMTDDASYGAGGILDTIRDTRAASDEQLNRLAWKRRNEARRAGITTLEVKSGYGLTVEHERRALGIARKLTPEVTFLGAHVVPEEYQGKADAYVDLVCGAMLDASLDYARWVDVFCEEGAFDADQSRVILQAGAARGLGMRMHGNQLGYGPGVRLAVELGCASVDHCTFLSQEDVEALAGGGTVATLLPASDFSTKQPYPDARRLVDAGATVALATNCNPGTSYTTSMGFCIAIAVRDMGMTPDQAVWSATRGGAQALKRHDVGVIRPAARADLAVLDSPTYVDFIYRPGVPLVTLTIEGGRAVADTRHQWPTV